MFSVHRAATRSGSDRTSYIETAAIERSRPDLPTPDRLRPLRGGERLSFRTQSCCFDIPLSPLMGTEFTMTGPTASRRKVIPDWSCTDPFKRLCSCGLPQVHTRAARL